MRVVNAIQRRLRRLRRRFTPLTENDIFRALTQLHPGSQPILWVHTSLSACGQIAGGPATVVAALRRWSAGHTLAMPTHTYCYPDAHGDVPVFDAATTPSRVGAITDYFWRQPGTTRSVHPTHSLAATGADSVRLCAGHERCDTPCGLGTPYGRLVNEDCAVLMFGATLAAYTLFHTAEAAAGVPYLYEPSKYTLQIRKADGRVEPFTMWRQDHTVARRFAEMDVWLEQRKLLLRQPLGLSQLLYLPHAADVHRMIVAELKTNPSFLLACVNSPRKSLD